MRCRHDIIGCAVCAGLVQWEAPEPTEGTERVIISHEAEALRITLQRADTRPPAYVHPARSTPTVGRETVSRIHGTAGYATRKPPPGRTNGRPQVERLTLDEWQPQERPQESAADMAARLGVTL